MDNRTSHNSLIPLEWDSDFFGYPVGSVVFDNDGLRIFDEVANKIRKEKYRLVSLFVSPSDIELNTRVAQFGAVLRDQKTLFSKVPEAHSDYKNTIKEYHSAMSATEIIRLGLQAGHYSRFRLDENFINNEYERLYTRWVTDSIARIIAFKTIVAVSDDSIIGMTTLGEKSGYADIGLVAVDSYHSGKGIGYDMVRYADNSAFEMKFDRIKVVTQMQNQIACKLYEKCNFTIERITNVYHYWQ